MVAWLAQERLRWWFVDFILCALFPDLNVKIQIDTRLVSLIVMGWFWGFWGDLHIVVEFFTEQDNFPLDKSRSPTQTCYRIKSR